MQYKLYKDGHNDTTNVLSEVLRNRGIIDYEKYLNLDESVIIPYNKLDNISEAVELFVKHYEAGNKIGILIDTDVDGYCSASMLYSYIKRHRNDYPLSYILHTRPKAHGLQDNLDFPDDMSLLIIPDAGTNDVNECKELAQQGIEVLILDHHGQEEENPYAVIVNNQISNEYENKELCGAGVVYKFLQALDEELWSEYADDYLDLVALANISDNMNLTSYETKFLVDTGLKAIKNEMMKALIKAQQYSMNDVINIHNVQWYLTPLINALIRVGTIEEKEILFRAFIEDYEEFDYHKRATKNAPAQTIKENIYDRAARFCKNAKPRQDRNREKSLTQIIDIAKSLSDDDKVILLDTTDVLENSLTGVVAIKVSEFFHKPCILLNKFNREIDGETTVVYGGSARNLDFSPIENFRNIINDTNCLIAKGHPNACGVELNSSHNFDEARQELNELLKDIVYDLTYYVDFILNIDDVSPTFIIDLSVMDNIICTGIPEPMVAIENISINTQDIKLIGANLNTMTFEIDGIKFIQFRCDQENELYDIVSTETNCDIIFNIVGVPTINEYDGLRIPQITIKDVNVIKTSKDTSLVDMFNDLDDEDDVWEI